VFVIILNFKNQENHIYKKNTNNFLSFQKFVLEAAKGEKLPPAKETERKLSITEDRRKQLYKEGLKNGLLYKNKHGKYMLNINFVEEEEEQDA